MEISEEISALIDGIKNNSTDGASELARQAVNAMKTAAERSEAETAREFLLEQKEVGKRLIAARRTMAPIPNIITRLLREIIREEPREDLESTRLQAIQVADELFNNSLNAVAGIIEYTAGLVDEGDRILTHSYSSTVLAALKAIAASGKSIEVVVTRSGSGRHGERVARELTEAGITVAYIDDTAAGLFVSVVKKVMVGADRICADGKLINGAGTYPLALASRDNEVPFYVLCETLKYDFSTKSDDVDLEDREPLGPAEIPGLIESGVLPPGTKIGNPAFDITPLDLVTAVITEDGILTEDKLLTG